LSIQRSNWFLLFANPSPTIHLPKKCSFFKHKV
jgi:hypothetical protein